MLSINPIAAQEYYETSADDINDYNYDVDNDLVLTDNQWHTDGTSILEANNNQYLVVQGQNRVRRTLYQPDYNAYGRLWNGNIESSSARPYYYNGNLGWAILCNALWYFVYPDGKWCRFNSRPNYYSDYYYPVRNCRHLNFYDWHFWSRRNHYNYHGHCYDRPRYNGHYRYNNGHFHYNEQRHSSRARSGNAYHAERRSSDYERSSVRNSSRSTGSSRYESTSRPSNASSSYQGTTSRRSSGVSTRSENSGSSYQGATSSPRRSSEGANRSSSGSNNYSRPARAESSQSSYRSGSSSGSSRSSATSSRSSSSSSGSSRSSRR